MRQFGGEGAGDIPPAPNPGSRFSFLLSGRASHWPRGQGSLGNADSLALKGVWVMQSVEPPPEPEQGGEVWRMVGQKEKISHLQILLF